MPSSTGRRVRPEAVVGIAVGVVALTAVGALAVGRAGDSTSDSFPPGHSRSEWAHGDHDGPPPWARGHGRQDRDEAKRDKDKDDKAKKERGQEGQGQGPRRAARAATVGSRAQALRRQARQPGTLGLSGDGGHPPLSGRPRARAAAA